MAGRPATWLAACALLMLAGCATHPEQDWLRGQATAVELDQVPFFAQAEYQCGPAALATVLAADGVDASPDALVPQVYLPGRRGSLQAELVATARRHGRVPYVLPPELPALIAELRAGRPVLVLQNLGPRRWPAWHYAVLVGYDAGRDRLLLRSGTTRRLAMPSRAFLASWERADRWAIVVTPPDNPPANADVVRWLQAVAPFESTGMPDLAARAYEAATRRWPDSAAAWTALGNIRHRQQRLDDAEAGWRRALQEDATPVPSMAGWVARHNLVNLLLDRHCPEEARVLLDGAGPPPAALAGAWQDLRTRLASAGPAACH